MRTWGVLLGVVALAVAACCYAALNLNRYLNENRDWIAERAEQAIGRRVDFDSVGISVRGGLGVRVDNVRVADDPDYSDLPFLRADALVVRVKILPALFGRYEVSRIVLEKPSLTVVRKPTGLNVGGLAAGESEPSETSTSGQAAAFVIAYLEVVDGRMEFVDETIQPPGEVVAAGVDFTASDVALDRPIDFRLQAAVLGEGDQNLSLEGKVGPLDRTDVGATPLQASLSLSPLRLDSLRRIPELAASLPDALTIEGPLSLEAGLSGRATALDVRASVDAGRARVAMGDAFVKPAGVPFSFRLAAVRGADAIEVSKAVLILRDAELVTKGTVRPGDPLSYELSTTGGPVALEGWGDMLPAVAKLQLDGTVTVDLATKAVAGSPRVAGSVTLSDVSVQNGSLPAVSGFSSVIRVDGSQISVPSSPFELGGSPARIEGAVQSTEPLHATLRMTSATLNAKSLGLQQDAEHADDVFRDVDLGLTIKGTASAPEISGSLKTAAGKLAGATYSDLVGQLRVKGSRAVLTPVSFSAFGGRMNGEGVYDFANADSPAFNFEASADRIQAGQLLAWLVPHSDALLSGTLSGKLSLAGTGSQWPSIRDSLVGGGRLDLAEGAIEDVNLVEQVLGGLTGVPGLTALLSPDLRRQFPQLFSTGRTTFDELTGGISIARGRIASDDLALKASDYLLTGGGSVGLDRSVDFGATFEASQQLTQALAKQVSAARYLADRSGRIHIPFRLSGTLPSVHVEPNLRMVESALKNAVVGNLTDALLGGGSGAPADRVAPAPGGSSAKKKKPGTETKGTPQEDAVQPTTPLDDVIRKGLGGLLGQ